MPPTDRSESYRYDPESSRCAANGSQGRCQLRGVSGHASASGGRWYCTWHVLVSYHGLFPSRDNFERVIDDLEASGDESWRKRPRDHWWRLVQGIPGPGSWQTRTVPEEAERLRAAEGAAAHNPLDFLE